MKRILRSYFLLSGVLAHVVLVLLTVFFVYYKVSDHWRVKQVVQIVSEPFSRSPVVQIVRGEAGQFDFTGVARGEWLKVHQMSADDMPSFHRQGHSGSAWDSNRQRLMIFGSDTHGKNWDNSVYFFDLESLSWSRSGAPDPRDVYRVGAGGLPVAGNYGGDRPWAMHTFDALAYDPINDNLIVASAPKHMVPGRFGNWMAGLWEKVSRHPTWLYSIGENTWRPAAGAPQDFFPFATAYDSNRHLLVGFKPEGIYAFNVEEEIWRKIASNSVSGYHTQAVYDSHNRAFILFGDHKKSNAVHSYRWGETKSKKMPTPGIRPPGDEHVPLAYNSRLKVTVALVDNATAAETWTYDLAGDSWRQIDSADFTFKLDMNYHMQYSAKHDLLVLVANRQGALPEVWILGL